MENLDVLRDETLFSGSIKVKILAKYKRVSHGIYSVQKKNSWSKMCFFSWPGQMVNF